MARTKKNAAVEEVKAAPVVEKEVKTAAVKKAPAKKTVAKKTVAVENVLIQYNGNEVNTSSLLEKAKSEANVDSAKKVDIYVKPEENMVYYVVDDISGSFPLY